MLFSRCLSKRLPVKVALLPLLFAIKKASATGIVADGNTATSVSMAANGHQTVNIALTVGGVSHNTYSSFNVSSAGADLNNVGVNARTIVNEVTSTNPSLIQGAIAVLGPRANVILANPNGITVDGGGFVNAGHVVLSTGQVTFNDLTSALGSIQRNVVLTTNGGAITIGPGGLSGTLVNLDLVAKRLAVSGPITNDFTTSLGGVRATIGNSTTNWDTSFSPSDNGHDWLISSTSPGVANHGFAIDITAAGGITGGRVELIVTDQGAGARNLGKVYASAGDAVVAANGDVTAVDGSINAAHDISITTPGNVTLQGAQVQAANNVLVKAGAVTLTDDATGWSTLVAQAGAVNVTTSGNISNTGSLIQAGAAAPNGNAIGGDVTLIAGGSVTNHSSAVNLGVVFSANGATSISSQGDITNDNARLLANGAVILAAQGDVRNVIDHTGGASGGQPSAYSSSRGRFLFLTHNTSGFNVDYGTVTQPSQLAYVASTGGTVTIKGHNVANSGGIIQSNNADINIAAQDTFTNAAVFDGQASYSRSCWIFCHASASSTVRPFGGTIQSGANLSINAGTVARNVGGNVYATGDLRVAAPTTYAQGVTGYSAITQDRGFKAFFGSSWAQILASDIGGGFTAGGTVSLTGDAVIDGGSIAAVKGVSATGTITTVRRPSSTPVQIGQHLGLFSWVGY
ncbi:filamentous hemagglutinin N-terminal domain-containing protein [Trinickia fusca]|uniref:Filamentous hemagglutinin N-terminal domain-containing protein n=1 Tax=Trinickia fusca TaxID=2419777 RepID=A0A494XC76_9BURK|nr:filamentous hemagglutinin N-terminal domain-containing protein [Trinickia fusca]RKP48365.1 filamentous hemagglutinin N-terminal domain-containing protein [Trinickia fusca]